ncbi:MAG: hypothetical protein CL573_00830 [Alphaproteobacteria bacterium]|nr:hypothetical protein [Alphaproteobacteria bacterium]
MIGDGSVVSVYASFQCSNVIGKSSQVGSIPFLTLQRGDPGRFSTNESVHYSNLIGRLPVYTVHTIFPVNRDRQCFNSVNGIFQAL